MSSELLEKLSSKLNQHNYKLTSQRKDILKVLIEGSERHYSVEELYQEVRKINPDVGLATIYRSLEILNELNIVHQLDFDNNYSRYELAVEGKHHHHLICMECGRIIEFNDQVLEEFEENLEKSYDFSIKEHRIKFYGKCSRCRKKEE